MAEKRKCPRCMVLLPLKFFQLKRNEEYQKLCNDCLRKARDYTKKTLCEHNRRRSRCKLCGGTSICEHNRIKSTCKECGGSSICEHNKIRSKCKLCGGGSICEHNRLRSHCKLCGGHSHQYNYQ